MFKPPSASKFRDKVVIERQSNVSDGMGGFQETWAEVATVSCAIFEAKGGEKVQSDRLNSISALDIHFRVSNDWDLTAADRLRNPRTGEVYNVTWVGALDQSRRHLLAKVMRGAIND